MFVIHVKTIGARVIIIVEKKKRVFEKLFGPSREPV